MLPKFRGAEKSRKKYGYHREIPLHCGCHHFFAMLFETTQCSEHFEFEESYTGCSSSADAARCWWAHRGTCRRGSDLDKKQKASAIVLQAWYRAVQTCTEYGKRYRTILFLQGHMGCHMAHQRYLLQLRSVAVMQRLFRRVPAQNSDCSLQGVFSNVGACTIVISCVYSSLLARSRLS